MRTTKSVSVFALVALLLVMLLRERTEQTGPSVALRSEASARESGSEQARATPTERGLAQLGGADVEYAPFSELVSLSSGAVVGIVTVVTEPTFNLPPGQSHNIHGDVQFPLIYSKATITVLRWMRNGSFPENQVTVVTEGGIVSRLLSPDEVSELEEHHPGSVEPGLAATGYSIGDAQFTVGETVALLLYQDDFGFVSGTETVPRVTGGAAGKFTVGDGDSLYNAVASVEHDPRFPTTLQEFEAMVAPGIEN